MRGKTSSTLEILEPLTYGQNHVIYNLKPEDVVSDKFFTSAEKRSFLKKGFIRSSKRKPTELRSKNTVQLVDLSKMTEMEVKEILSNEFEVTSLGRYIYQEQNQPAPRESLMKWIEGRINELTGFEPSRVR